MRDSLKFYRLSDATFYDHINIMYQFIKPFFGIKNVYFEEYEFEEYGAFKCKVLAR